jgi:hypothetical protein
MLRDYQADPSDDQIIEILKRFKLDHELNESTVELIDFESLSPDSFVWELTIDKHTYFLYAEDYVSGLDYIKDEIDEYLNHDKWNFIAASHVTPFESSTPVKGATVYQKPERTDDMMKYAVDSGFDFVFLVKIKN